MNQPRNAPPQQAIVLGSKQNLQALLAKPNVGVTIERVATKWLSAEQIKTQAAIAVSRNPGLLKCTQASFLESMVRAAELGLRFTGAGGEAYLVPYKSRCTLIIGYRGLCALARRTGMVTRIEARVVHEKDVFEVGYGSGQTLVHRPHLGADRGEIVAAYAIAELKDSDDQIEVMTRAELDQVRKRSPSGSDGPWVPGHSKFETTHRFYLAVADDLVDRARQASDAAVGQVLARAPDSARKRRRPASTSACWPTTYRTRPKGLEPSTFGSTVRPGVL